MKNNIEYYRHTVDAHEHWKFKVLRKAYGWAGEGKFWALNNMIGKAKGCLLVMESKAKEAAIAVELDFTPAELKAFIRYLVDDCELLLEQNGGYTNNMIQEVLEGVEEKREAERLRKQRAVKKKKDNAGQELMDVVANENVPQENVIGGAETAFSDAENEQSKVKETKVNKTKAEESIGVLTSTRPLNPAPSPEDIDGFRKFSDWIANYTPCVALMKEPFTLEQYINLGAKHHIYPDEIKSLLTVMHNWQPLVSQNRSAYYTLLKWRRGERR
ncbi:MAG TPA: Lin1244/Lin1753 domain-containing protein [Chitinophagaceae bacterium]|nr:Lin1244/Lin1753 domain-containing protein [Chitinophagaceae bacterium]